MLCHIPVAETHWRNFTEALDLHFPRDMLDNFRALVPRTSFSLSLGTTTGGDICQMFTAVLPSRDPAEYRQSFAVTSTYFAKTKHSTAVIFGLSTSQMEFIQNTLEGSTEQFSHPFRIVQIFIELQQERLESTLQTLLDQASAFEIQLDPLNLQNRTTDLLNWNFVRTARRHLSDAVKLDEDMRCMKAVTEKAEIQLMDSLKFLAPEQDGGTSAAGRSEGSNQAVALRTAQCINRIREIGLQYDMMIAACRRIASDLSIAIESFQTGFDMLDKKEACRRTKLNTILAVIAAIYLPFTSVATILAMPVFKFENDWKDWRWNSVPTKGMGDLEANSSNNPANPPVFSGYFYIFLAIGGGLLLLTGAWWKLYFEVQSNMRARNRVEVGPQAKIIQTREQG
ncbi:hypothetical protein B0T21DRAFT_416538 [Apiosordaria backusii]|uniref:Uncharacterized protein n=1 Tax=Apiosordaria backusii TaxID=314023 RepID=A0AA39ZY92_9PEZI|nr:hypothetical protein B0T21DRAFT_416538 [Apiosordaria backusii]